MDASSFIVVAFNGGGRVVVVTGRSVEKLRWELVDGLLIIVIIKRSSVGCETVAFRFANGIFKNDEKLFFGLFGIARDDVDDAGDGVEEIDLITTVSVDNKCEVD